MARDLRRPRPGGATGAPGGDGVLRTVGRRRRARVPHACRGRSRSARNTARACPPRRLHPNVSDRRARVVGAPPRRRRAGRAAHRHVAAAATPAGRRRAADRDEPAGRCGAVAGRGAGRGRRLDGRRHTRRRPGRPGTVGGARAVRRRAGVQGLRARRGPAALRRRAAAGRWPRRRAAGRASRGRSGAGLPRARRRRQAARRLTPTSLIPVWLGGREARVVADRLEVGVLRGVCGPLRLQLDRLPQVGQRIVRAASAGLHAREVVEQGRMVGLLDERLLMDADRLVPPLFPHRRNRQEHRLPGRDLVRSAGLPAEREHDRVRIERHRAAAQHGIADEDELAGAQLVLVALDREARAAAQHEVDLLVLEVGLAVLLDDLRAGLPRRIGVDTEALDPEPAAHRAPDEAVGHLDPVEVVDVRRLHEKSSCQRGSSCSVARSSSWGAKPRTASGSSSTALRSAAKARSASPWSASKQAELYGPGHSSGCRAISVSSIARPPSTSPARALAKATTTSSQPRAA